MPGLNILVLTDDAERFRGALTLALAQAALGGAVRLFLQLDAVRLLRDAAPAPCDADHGAHGLPTLAVLIDEALEAGIAIVACQSGLALTGLAAAALDARIEAGGPLSFLQGCDERDRLIVI